MQTAKYFLHTDQTCGGNIPWTGGELDWFVTLREGNVKVGDQGMYVVVAVCRYLERNLHRSH